MALVETQVTLTTTEKDLIVQKLLSDELLSIGEFNDFMIDIFQQRQRTFVYETPFPAADADCSSKFDRSFVHQDWIDGESVVQAEQSTGEDGFNARFHHIEADLDSLAADTATAFLCIAQMRASLSALLEELRAEINRINGDIFNCCQEDTGGIVVDPVFTGTFAGISQFDDTDYLVYKAADRITLVPRVNPPTVIKPVDPFEDFRVRNAAGFARLLAEDPQIVEQFGNGPVSKEDLVRTFGNKEIRDGVKVSDVTPILPAGQFASLQAMVDSFAERTAIAIDLSGGRETVATYFGVGKEIGSIEEAPLEKVSVVPSKAVAVLQEAGIGTLGALAEAEPRRLVIRLRAAGIETTAAEVNSWIAVANVFRRIR